MKKVMITLFVAMCLSMTFTIQLLATPSHADSGLKPDEVLKKLVQGNDDFVSEKANTADISKKRRETTTTDGQHPYAIVVTCADSRVPVEHIFSAGVGDIFVIRVAGNVVGDIELASIDYGIKHCGAKVVMVMGHTKCGAVSAAAAGYDEEYISSIMGIIKPVIAGTNDISEAEKLNVKNSYDAVVKSGIVKEKVEKHELKVVQAIFHINDGKVEILN